MTILPMTRETAGAVADLEEQSFPTPWSRKDILAELENPWAIWLTAMEGDTLMGYLGVQYGPDGGDIMSIATAPAARGKGTAKALLARMEEILREKGLRWLTLEVRPSNQSAIGLYASRGFRQVGRRPRYYQKPTEDAILMTKYFTEEAESC